MVHCRVDTLGFAPRRRPCGECSISGWGRRRHGETDRAIPACIADLGGRQVRMTSRIIGQADVGPDSRNREVRGGQAEIYDVAAPLGDEATFDRFGRYRVLSTKSAPMGEEIAVHRVRAAGWLRDRLFVKTEFPI